MPLQFQTSIDQSFSPVLFTPDFTFLKYVIDKKTERYEKGLSSVSSSYSALRKQLTDPTNIERRNQYFKNADVQLQKLAGSDFSLQENVNAANSLFEPMITDKAFIYDAYYTAQNKKELEKMESWRNSDDLETRRKFNPQIYDWLKRDLDSLKTGNGNVSNYKVMGRKSWAYINPQEILTKAVKDYGFETFQDIDGGTYITGVKDGVKFKKNYRQFAQEVLLSDPLYTQQSNILGEATYEQLLDQGKAQEKDEKQTILEYATTSYDKYKNRRKEYISQIQGDLEKELKEIQAEKSVIDLSTPDGQQKNAELTSRAMALKQNLGQYNSLKQDYDNEFGGDKKSSEEKRLKYIKSFTENPKEIFSSQYREQDITSFSNIKSASEKITIKKNDAYFSALNSDIEIQKTFASILNAMRKTDISERGQDLKEDIFDWKKADQPITGKLEGTETVTNADGTTTTRAKKSPLTFSGMSASDISRPLNYISTLQSKLALKRADALNNLIGTNGGAVGILENMGVDRNYMPVIRDYFRNYEQATANEQKYTPTEKEKAALRDVYSSLFAFSKQTGNEAALNKLRQLHGVDPGKIDFHELLDLSLSGVGWNALQKPENLQQLMQWQDHKNDLQSMQQQAGMLKKAKDVVMKIAANNPEYRGLIENGQVITKENILKSLDRIPQVKVTGSRFFSDDVVALTPELKNLIAEGYLNGKTVVTIQPGTYQGKTGTWLPGKVTMKMGNNSYYYTLNTDYEKAAFPMNSSDFQAKLTKLYTQIPIDQNVSADSDFKANPIWDVTGDVKDNLVKTIDGPYQHTGIVFSGSGTTATVLDKPEEIDRIRTALKDPKNVTSLKVHSSSSLNNQGLALEVTLRDAKKDETKAEETHWGGTYTFPINLGAGRGIPEILQNFAVINDQNEYLKIRNAGAVHTMYDFTNLGIKVEILPNSTQSDDGKIYITAQKQDPTTGAYLNDNITTELPYNMSTMTYPELKNVIRMNYLVPYLSSRMNYNQQKQRSPAGLSTTDMGQLNNILSSIKIQ
jgi:hypothetical protein